MDRHIFKLPVHGQAEEQPEGDHKEAVHQKRAAVDAAQEGGLGEIREDQVRFAAASRFLARRDAGREQKQRGQR